MERPRKCMYPNCERCVYMDCIYDGLESKDVLEQDMFDKKLEVVEPEISARKERQKRYNTTDKGKERFKRYAQTDKFKKSQDKYNNSEKGKERWRRYYYKKKMEMQMG